MLIDHSVIQRFEEGVPFFPQDLPVFASTPSRNVVLMGLLVNYLKNRRADGPVRILEVGSRAGGSTLAWIDAINGHADGQGKILCVDMWYKLGVQDDVFFSIFRHNVKVSDSQNLVVPIVGDSLQVLPALQKDYFDFIYIDGAHCYSVCSRDMQHAKSLVRPGGIICGDDLEIQHADCDKTLLETLKEQDAAFDPIPWHPGVTKAVFENFGTVSPFMAIWAVQKGHLEDCFTPMQPDRVPRHEIPSYFPDWARRVAEHELGLESSSNTSHEQHLSFIASAQSTCAPPIKHHDEIRRVDFAQGKTLFDPMKVVDVTAINSANDEWAVTSVNGRPELYASHQLGIGLTLSVVRPFGTTDIGIQLPVHGFTEWRGRKLRISANIRTNGTAQLNLYDGVLGFGDKDAPSVPLWQTLEWTTFLPTDAECFAPQIRLHGTRGAIVPGTHISVAWIVVRMLDESASAEEMAQIHCLRAIHYIEMSKLEKAETAMANATNGITDIDFLSQAIGSHGFSVPALRKQASEMLLRHAGA